MLGKRPGEDASGRGARSSKRARQVRSQGGHGSRVNPVVVPESTNHGVDASSIPARGLVTGGAVRPHDSSPLQHSNQLNMSPELHAVKREAECLTKPFQAVIACMPRVASAFQQHVLILALDKAQFNLISAFAREKAMHPAQVSGCLLVPNWVSAWFNPCLKGMAVLKEYPAGHVAPFPTKLVYCPPDQVALGAVSGGEVQTSMVFRGQIAGYPGRIAIDSQASHSFISHQRVRQMGLHTVPGAQVEVTLGTGSHARVYGSCSVKFRVGPLVDSTVCYVIDMAPEFDLILGDKYLRARDAILSYKVPQCVIHKGLRKYSLKPAPLEVEPAEQPPLLTALQLKRALRKPAVLERSYLVVVQKSSCMQTGRSDAAVNVDVAWPLDRPSTSNCKGAGVVGEDANLGVDAHGEDANNASVGTSQSQKLKSVNLSGPCPREDLAKLLEEYKDVWPPALPPGLPPMRDITVQHTINLVPGAVPPKPRMYRLSPLERAEVEKQVKELLAKGYIQPSSSPFGAPILFVPKPNGSLRMCTDYRALNALTQKDSFPLPRIDDLLDQVGQASVFSSLDLTQGYYQLRVSPDDVPKTAFKTHLGLFEWKVLSFGLTNAPATFQRAMQSILAPYLGKFVCVYLDDICIYSNSPDQHVEHLRLVLQTLREHKFYMNLDKCEFNKAELKFLGHLVSKGKVRPDPAKVKTVENWPLPQSVHDLRSFLGLTNYFRKHVPNYAQVTMPLTALLKKGVLFDCSTPECVEAINKLKLALTSEPVLHIADPAKPYTVDCDASGFALGAVLLQEGHPIAYESRKFTAAEKNYSVGDRELCAVVHALTVWRCYLLGAQFTVMSDHQPLTYLATQPNLSGRQVRWQQLLSRYHFDWQYKKGSSNSAADALSRNPLFAAVTRASSRGGEKSARWCPFSSGLVH